MDYKFGEYIKKKESDFLGTKVNGSDLIRISDANNYFNSYKKQFSLSDVSQQRELLIAYNVDFYKGIHDVDLKHIEANVDKYLSKL